MCILAELNILQRMHVPVVKVGETSNGQPMRIYLLFNLESLWVSFILNDINLCPLYLPRAD